MLNSKTWSSIFFEGSHSEWATEKSKNQQQWEQEPWCLSLYTSITLFFSVQEFRFLEDKKLSVVPMSRRRMHLWGTIMLAHETLSLWVPGVSKSIIIVSK
jgi:hypothetical protein